MSGRHIIAPPAGWPPGIELRIGGCDPIEAEPAFRSSEGPWSRAYRLDGAARLEWRNARFHITSTAVVVDADDPDRMVDLYWNSLVATVEELRGTPTLHGFMAAGATGRGVAVIGESGAGKTTTGLALLAAGCSLVCDDLIILGPGGVPPGRPFVRRLPEAGARAPLDVGGKWRMPAPIVQEPVRLGRILALVETEHPELVPLASLPALDMLLRHPYLPFAPNRDGARTRLEAMSEVAARVDVAVVSPRSRPAAELAAWLCDE